MKKTILTILLCGGMVLGITGCGNGENNLDNANNTSVENTNSNTVTCVGPSMNESMCKTMIDINANGEEVPGETECYARGKNEIKITFDETGKTKKLVFIESFTSEEAANIDKSSYVNGCRKANNESGVECSTSSNNGFTLTVTYDDISKAEQELGIKISSKSDLKNLEDDLNKFYKENGNKEMKHTCK